MEHVSAQEIADWHRPRMQALAEADVDLLAFETIPAQKEAETLVELLKEFPKLKAWLSFSCKVSAACLIARIIAKELSHNISIKVCSRHTQSLQNNTRFFILLNITIMGVS
jgi:S-methylmethionine-dependent homocysteine/selenocysteine methylase